MSKGPWSPFNYESHKGPNQKLYDFMKNRQDMFTTTFFVVGSLALCTIVQAVTPPPDGGYPGGNTAEGQNALFSLTTGTYNTAVGFLSLESDIAGQFNTAIGAGALLAGGGARNRRWRYG